jgi:hypothetical protein
MKPLLSSLATSGRAIEDARPALRASRRALIAVVRGIGGEKPAAPSVPGDFFAL